MEINQELKDSKTSFLSHVFSSSDESKGEMVNVVQYALLGVIPVLLLNKLIHRFIPEADPDKSSIELLVEIAIQLMIIFIGIIIVHRMITFIPPYSGFKYESLNLTTVVLGFLVIVFSIQSKIGLKANILADRVYVLWNGPTENMENNEKPKRQPTHTSSRADNQPTESFALQDHIMPNPVAVQKPQQQAVHQDAFMVEPMAANALLGSSY